MLQFGPKNPVDEVRGKRYNNCTVAIRCGKQRCPGESGEGREKSCVKENESLESALKRFKRSSSGVLAEVRKREHYEKPSVKRKKKAEAARKRKY